MEKDVNDYLNLHDEDQGISGSNVMDIFKHDWRNRHMNLRSDGEVMKLLGNT